MCENFSKVSGKSTKVEFEKYQSVLNLPMKPRILIQISEYNGKKDEYFKNKTSISLPSKYSVSFSGSDDELVYILVSIKIHANKYMDSGHYICDLFYYNKVALWRCDDNIITN